MELVERFFLGGPIVSAFAVLGYVLRPKGFAGLFGAAPEMIFQTIILVECIFPAILGKANWSHASTKDFNSEIECRGQPEFRCSTPSVRSISVTEKFRFIRWPIYGEASHNSRPLFGSELQGMCGPCC